MSRLGMLLLSAVFVMFWSFRSAEAKEVSLEWEALDRAILYELQIEQDGRLIIHKTLEKPRWSGELAVGAYTYKLRGLDRFKAPGTWTPAAPLVVMAPAPTPISPDNGALIGAYQEQVPVALSWGRIPGVKKYLLSVQRAGSPAPFRVQSADGLSIQLKSVPPGDYSWTVSALIEGTQKNWTGPASKAREFAVKRFSLAKPAGLEPSNAIPPSSDRLYEFSWDAIEKAQAYELTISRDVASGPKFESRPMRVQDNSVLVKLPSQGHYTWRVRALAQINEKNLPAAIGPESVSRFQISAQAPARFTRFQASLFAFSAPCTYELNNPAQDSRISANAGGTTLGLNGEFWFSRALGTGILIRDDMLNLNRQSQQQLSAAAVAKYRIELGNERRPWTIGFALGPELRHYALLSPTYSADALVGISSRTLSAFGAAIGLEIRKVLSSKWAAGIGLQVFRPFSISDSSATSLKLGSSSSGNTRASAAISYDLDHSWTGSIGAASETRGLAFEAGDLLMSARYVFGMITYRFQ